MADQAVEGNMKAVGSAAPVVSREDRIREGLFPAGEYVGSFRTAVPDADRAVVQLDHSDRLPFFLPCQYNKTVMLTQGEAAFFLYQLS